MRARFRQFFMRVDFHDNHHVTPAHLGVSKQRTLNVYVETVRMYLDEFSFMLYIPFSSRYRRVSCPAVLDIPVIPGTDTILILIQSNRHLLQIHAHKCVCTHEMSRSRPCRRSTLQLQKEYCRQVRILVHTNERETSCMVIYIIIRQCDLTGTDRSWRKCYRPQSCETYCTSYSRPARRDRGREGRRDFQVD